MRAILPLTLIVIACLAPCSVTADAAAPRVDHYNPILLNEQAVRKVREGDIATAAVLLERAVLIAPHDARIRRNLATLRAWQSGQPEPVAPVEPATASEPASGAIVELPPFPLWHKK